jgi:ATP-dependent Clp protease ATP-binding subunit ClpC
MSMWEPFTEHARRAIVLAQEEAQRLGAGHIEPAHILVGILQESGAASQLHEVLAKHGLTLDALREHLPKATGGPAPQEMIFTSEAKRVVEQAFEIARERGQHFIAPQHLLYAILHGGSGAVDSAMKALRIDVAKLEAEAMALLPETAAPETTRGMPFVRRVQEIKQRLLQMPAESLLDEQVREVLRDLAATIRSLLHE